MIRAASVLPAGDALERIVARLAQLGTVTMIGPDSAIAPCPMGHPATLTVNIGGGRVTFACSAGCDPELLAAALGIGDSTTNRGALR